MSTTFWQTDDAGAVVSADPIPGASTPAPAQLRGGLWIALDKDGVLWDEGPAAILDGDGFPDDSRLKEPRIPQPISVAVQLEKEISGFLPVSPEEWKSLTDGAFKAMQDAYEGYAVKISQVEPGKRYDRWMYVKNMMGPREGEVGSTNGLFKFSDVYFWSLKKALRKVVGCPDTLGFNECGEQTGLPRQEWVTALGRGLGATAAHELGHQAGFNFTRDVTDRSDCYDSDSAVSSAHFFGALHWSGQAAEIMRRVLPRPR